MEQISDAKKQVEDALKTLSEKYSEPKGLYEPAWEFVLSGGKRLRPAIVLLAARTAGKDQNAIISATAIELLHNFTLIHDDIMDKSEFRRQIPTVYKKYGINQAILSGDVLMILAFEILKDLPSDMKPLVFEKLAEAARIVCEGQQYDMDIDWKTVSMEDYLKIVSNKTAALLRYSAEIGVLSANPNNNTLRESLGKAMFYAGIAFQIIDDYIDLFSDQTGKTRGLDIKEKKPSAIIVAINSLEDKRRGSAWNTVQKFVEGKIDESELIDRLKQFGVDKTVRSIAEKYLSKAERIIENTNFAYKHLWKDLVALLISRNK